VTRVNSGTRVTLSLALRFFLKNIIFFVKIYLKANDKTTRV